MLSPRVEDLDGDLSHLCGLLGRASCCEGRSQGLDAIIAVQRIQFVSDGDGRAQALHNLQRVIEYLIEEPGLGEGLPIERNAAVIEVGIDTRPPRPPHDEVSGSWHLKYCVA